LEIKEYGSGAPMEVAFPEIDKLTLKFDSEEEYEDALYSMFAAIETLKLYTAPDEGDTHAEYGPLNSKVSPEALEEF
jgi:hypothetical protein